MYFTEPVLDGMLDDLNIKATHVSLHTASPGSTGASEVGSLPYLRQPLVWADASGGAKIAAPVTFQVPAGVTITHLGFWDSVSGGAFSGGSPLDGPETFLVDTPYVLTVNVTTDAITALATTGGTMSGPIDMGGHKITGLATATASGDAVALGLMRAELPWISARSYGAMSDGVTDDSAAIQAALDAAAPGQTVWLPGNHAISSPPAVPPLVTLRSSGGAHAAVGITRPTLIGLPGLTVAALLLVDQTTGGYSIVSDGQRLEGLTIELDAVTAGTVDGIQAQGKVGAVWVRDVQIRNAPRDGFKRVTNGSGSPQNWHVTRFHVASSGGDGIDASMADSMWIDCEALGTGGVGWKVGTGCANTLFIGCRSEWAGTHNWHLTGDTGDWQGSGGYSLIGCSTDSAARNGVLIDAAGKAPIQITGLTTRRDGHSSGSSGYAAINVNGAAAPVRITGWTSYPGLHDDGTGINRPQRGLSVTNATSVAYADCHIHAATTAVHDGGGNTKLWRGPNIIERVGTMSTFTETSRGLIITEAGVSTTVPITLPGAPSSANHAATKAYVDGAVVGTVPRCQITRNATLALTTATDTTVTLDTSIWQVGGTWWTTGTTITIPTGTTGIYHVAVRAIFQNAGTNAGFRAVWFKRVSDGFNAAAQSISGPGASAGNWMDVTASDIALLTAGDQYRVVVRQDSGGALTLFSIQVSLVRLAF